MSAFPVSTPFCRYCKLDSYEGPDSRLPKQVFYGELCKGKRPLEGKRRSKDNIKTTLKDLGIDTANWKFAGVYYWILPDSSGNLLRCVAALCLIQSIHTHFVESESCQLCAFSSNLLYFIWAASWILFWKIWALFKYKKKVQSAMCLYLYFEIEWSQQSRKVSRKRGWCKGKPEICYGKN